MADWLPAMASQGSPVWQAAQQPPPASPPALVPKAAPMSPSHADSRSPSPPQARPEAAQPKVPSPNFQPTKQPTYACPLGPLLYKNSEGAQRMRQSVPSLPARAVQPHEQRCAGRRFSDIASRSSPATGSPVSPAVREPQSLSPPPLRMPSQASPTAAQHTPSPRRRVQSPKDTCQDSGDPGRRPSFGPFRAPPGQPGQLDQPVQLGQPGQPGQPDEDAPKLDRASLEPGDGAASGSKGCLLACAPFVHNRSAKHDRASQMHHK